MKYRDLPRMRFKRGTTRKMRRQAGRLSRQIFEDLYKQGVQRVFLKASTDALIFGEGRVSVGWDEVGGMAIANVPPRL